jgi:hypothetical protein
MNFEKMPMGSARREFVTLVDVEIPRNASQEHGRQHKVY